MSIASNFPSSLPSLLLDFANVKRLDPRITFTRTTTATYYDGVTTAKAEENLLTYSQEFDNAAWSKFGSSVTANAAVAPDGTTTADKLVESNLTEPHGVYQGVSFLAATYTFSWYAKAAGRSWVHTRGALAGQTYFDVTNGVLGTVPAGVTATITSVGNGWYRCTVSETISSGGSGTVQIACGTANNTDSTAGDGTSGVFLWGAQLEQRSSATAYTATTTQAITNYIPVLQTAAAGQARFDHNPTTGESLGLLIEEARTNLFTYSADFSSWSLNNGAIQSNVIVAPDGTLTGDKYAVGTTNGNNAVYRAATTTAVSHTFSVIAKAGELSFLILSSPVFGYRTYFNLSTGVIGSVAANHTATMTGVGNGWYRCTVTMTTLASTTNWAIEATNTDGVNVYVGNNFNGIYVWGAQLEAGSFATSYIPTVASSVTRNADAASMTGTNFSSWFNNGEGTLYAEASTSAANTAKRFAQIDSGAESNRIQIAAEASGTTKNFAVVTNSSTQAYTPVSASYPVKVGAGYKVNDFGASFNGGAIQTDTSGTVPALSVMRFGAASDASENMNGCLRKVSYYPAKATSAQIVGLTT